MRTHQAVWDPVWNSPRILTSSMGSASNSYTRVSRTTQYPMIKRLIQSKLREWDCWAQLETPCPSQALLFSLPKLPRQPHCIGPRSISAKISQDILEKSCTDLGQVRLCCEWLWCTLALEKPCAVWGCRHHLGPIQVACPLQAFSSHSD